MSRALVSLVVAVALLGGAGLLWAQEGPAEVVDTETTPAPVGLPDYPVANRGDQYLVEGRYAEAADFYAARAEGAAGLERDRWLIRRATAEHLDGYHNRAWELLKEVCLRYTGNPGAVADEVYRAVDEMIINRRALQRHQPYELPEEPDEPHPRDDFHFDSLAAVPDLRRTTRPGDTANLDIESAPEDEFTELTTEELAGLTTEELQEYEERKAAWEREQRRRERLASSQADNRSLACFDLYYATYYLALLRELDPAGAAELRRRIINEVIEVELETVAWFVNYSHVCPDVESAVADAEGSAAYWSASHLLLTREVARMVGERFNLYLFSRQCGGGVGMHDIKRQIHSRLRVSEAHTVTVKSYGGDGITNPAYRAYAAVNGSLICSVGEILRGLGHYPENWRIPQLRDFEGPQTEEAFTAGEGEGEVTGLEDTETVEGPPED